MSTGMERLAEVAVDYEDALTMLTEDKHQLLVSLGAQIDTLKDRERLLEGNLMDTLVHLHELAESGHCWDADGTGESPRVTAALAAVKEFLERDKRELPIK